MATDNIRLRQKETCLQPGGKDDEQLHPDDASSHAVLHVITTGDTRRPLDCIWLAPQFRSLQVMSIEQTTTTGAKTNPAGEQSSGLRKGRLLLTCRMIDAFSDAMCVV